MRHIIPYSISIILFLGVQFLQAGKFIQLSSQVIIRSDSVIVQNKTVSCQRPIIGLVLSGGGSRGFSHIGVLQALEDYNVTIGCIVGTSVGSMIGGLYAAGYSPKEIQRIIKSINWSDIYRDETQRTSLFLGQKGEHDRYLLSVRFDGLDPHIPKAFSPGQRLVTILTDLFLKANYQARDNYDVLRIPFRAVATDLVSGKIVVLKDGNLAESINASLALPLLFSPVERDSMLLVDGGLISNLPVNAANNMGADLTIAVDATANLRSVEEINAPWEIVDQATTIMSRLGKLIESNKADVLIKPALTGIKNNDFTNIDWIIEQGYKATEEKLDNILYKISKKEADSILCENVAKIVFKNNPEMLPLEILDHLKTKVGSALSLNDLNEDVQTFIASGIFKRVSVTVDSIGNAANSCMVTFHFKTFAKIRSISFSGNTLYSDQQLLKILFLSPGKVMNSSLLKQDIKILIRQYRRDGYSLMKIKEIHWQPQTGELAFVIDEGRIDELRVIGNRKTLDYVILRDFNIQRGEVFNSNRINEAVRHVYSTQLFERVTVDIKREKEKNILLVRVSEKSSQVARLGGKVDSDRKSQIYLELSEENILGTGVKTRFVGRIGTRDGYYGLHLRDDRIFTTYFTFSIKGYFGWEVNPYNIRNTEKPTYYREKRTGVIFTAGRQMGSLGQFFAELRSEHILAEALNPDRPTIQNTEIRTIAIRSIADKRDRIDFPTKGFYNYWAWESGSELLLKSQESYTRLLVNLEGYFTYANLHTWHLRLFAGVGDKTVPFSENFRLGGLNNFYGLYMNELYGRQLFLTNLEYRFLLPLKIEKNMLIKGFYLSARFDFAGIWPDPELVFNKEDFFTAIGAALSVDTLLGPFILAAGRTSRGQTATYISLGFNF
ncbi:MAG TPA: hypothetical protein EYP36_01270 [Calditrichaeota bacterium]|nr:hypothetical protein [Calditrichota bacterium]